MEAGLLRGIFTVLMLVLFAGICVWAWSGRRTRDFEEASALPLESDDGAPPAVAHAAHRLPGARRT